LKVHTITAISVPIFGPLLLLYDMIYNLLLFFMIWILLIMQVEVLEVEVMMTSFQNLRSIVDYNGNRELEGYENNRIRKFSND